jgi:23S rRNA pseudouridine2605 synthase
MSRRAAEEYIKDGRVTVNERIVSLGESANENDIIAVDGVPLEAEPRKIYIMLNKPRGVVCTMSDERGRATVAELVSDVSARLLPVGRLDMDSEGLLLMTNDNEMINKLTHPSFEIDKEYHVNVMPGGTCIEEAVIALQQPMDIDGYITKPAQVRVIESNTLSIVIHEGRKRQVRHMCKNAGLHVERLIRVRIGKLALGNLESGKWKHCNFSEV